jgi:hypothetical protein
VWSNNRSIENSTGLFHRPRPPTPCHIAPAGARTRAGPCLPVPLGVPPPHRRLRRAAGQPCRPPAGLARICRTGGPLMTRSGPPQAARGRTAGAAARGWFKRYGTRPKGGVKPGSSCSMDAQKGMARCGGGTHTGRSRTHWGYWQDAGRPALPSGRERGSATPGPDDGCCAPTRWSDRGRSRSLPGAVRRRTRQRLLGGHTPGQSGAGPPPASDAGGFSGSPRRA